MSSRWSWSVPQQSRGARSPVGGAGWGGEHAPLRLVHHLVLLLTGVVASLPLPLLPSSRRGHGSIVVAAEDAAGRNVQLRALQRVHMSKYASWV